MSSHDGGNSEARARLGMPVRYGSCHSAEASGYAIEGHVPAREIHRLLKEMPNAIGLSVPAMPRGSPGMDGPVYGRVREPYDVLLIARDGTAGVINRIDKGGLRMKYRIQSLVAVTAALALVGCGEPAQMSDGSAETGAMPGMDRAQGGDEHIAQGTVNSIDRTAGMINISHEPVESAGWPAMTMNFRLAEPDAAAELEPGQQIEFRFTMDGEATVTAIDLSQ